MKTVATKSKIVFLSTYPPTQCGIATFTQDTINAINKIYGKSITCEICEITFNELGNLDSAYHLQSKDKDAYKKVAALINEDDDVKLVHIQHEFGLYGGHYGDYLINFLNEIKKPIAFTFHSVIPNPDQEMKALVQLLCTFSKAIFVMTKKSKKILLQDYNIDESNIAFVPHGTHLVDYETSENAKTKLDLQDRLILSTFGLLGQGKSVETGLKALPKIVEKFPNVLYLILGKTHPNTIIDDVDVYRNSLIEIVEELNLQNNVRFVNEYIEVNQLLDYLKATDVYLFTSKDPNQAVSGTFSYAMSCSCPIVASKIPHTLESLTSDIGILADIQNVDQFATATLKLLSNPELRTSMALNAYAKTTKTSWENTAIKHINAYQKIAVDLDLISMNYPEIKMDHQKAMTTNIGMIQFSKISEPDLDSGYTLDDNARALISICKHYQLTEDASDIEYMKTYLNFMIRCQLPDGNFINYVDQFNVVEPRNNDENLEDSNGRAIWALGYLLTLNQYALPYSLIYKANLCINKSIDTLKNLSSPRAICFSIKGLCYLHSYMPTITLKDIIDELSEKVKRLYKVTSTPNWNWFENKLTYANSVLPEALLASYLVTGKESTKTIAIASMDFLISKMFVDDTFKIISNKGWHQKGAIPHQYGEQPIEACYMMNALDLFYKSFGDTFYKSYLQLAFDWYLGKNHLNHIMYNPITGGCYDGLEKENVNLNQGAESTVCYLSARLLAETYVEKKKNNYVSRLKSFQSSKKIASFVPITI
ncbi:Glycosyltransferase involved in cell wall bisynthesis [Flavobacterium segetis]|uniref:Glycosyltransferase involved in cell wall bisynthesis n=1 Tax=Flavobacterium segetis TaxID=271157 RepID=A0A1M5J322_9FLAO|nr:glycosyltransferase [Flavobacterium segetis]SHG34921.1 Glycosyltransferase involved in cell wall bisynthesis [Flavobacterium segetis]